MAVQLKNKTMPNSSTACSINNLSSASSNYIISTVTSTNKINSNLCSKLVIEFIKWSLRPIMTGSKYTNLTIKSPFKRCIKISHNLTKMYSILSNIIYKNTKISSMYYKKYTKSKYTLKNILLWETNLRNK